MYFRQLLLLSLLGLALSAPSTKIEPGLSKALINSNVPVNIFVKFEEGTTSTINAVNLLQFNSRTEKINHMVTSLKALVSSTQIKAATLLQSPQFAYSATSFKQFWVSNELYVKGASAELVSKLASLPEVSEIREERVATLEDVTVMSQDDGWNLDRIDARGAWGLPGGNNGVGVVVANIDTGARSSHEALRNNFRSEYGWFDPNDGAEQPRDDMGHGTHTMGIIAGAGVGVAPGAQWIACQGCGSAACLENALKQCGQWLICPTLPDGSNQDCSKSPHVVSNSWGGRGNDDWFNSVITAWQAAKIIPVFAFGGSGPGCNSGGSPGDQEQVIGVSSTTMIDGLSARSSNGPAFDGRIKPDLSAPGEQIRSAYSTSDTAYVVLSGSSVSTPHVAGAIALLLSTNPNLTYQQVKTLLEENADRESLEDMNRTCNGIPSTDFPNNQYGHGRLNARKALEAAINGI